MGSLELDRYHDHTERHKVEVFVLVLRRVRWLVGHYYHPLSLFLINITNDSHYVLFPVSDTAKSVNNPLVNIQFNETSYGFKLFECNEETTNVSL